MLVDANLLLYAVDEDSPFHTPAKTWIEYLRSRPYLGAVVLEIDAERAMGLGSLFGGEA